MADRFIDFNPAAGNDGNDGSSGSPWNTILYAISVFPDTEDWNVYLRGTGGVVEQVVSSQIQLNQGWANKFNVYPDTGFEPTADPPTWPLMVSASSGFTSELMNLDDGNIWEGVALNHYNTSSNSARVGRIGDNATFRAVRFTIARNGTILLTNGTNFLIENCEFYLDNASGGADGIFFNQYNADGDVKGCVFYDGQAGTAAIGIGTGGGGWQAHVNGCLFYNNDTDVSDPGNKFLGEYNATTKSTPDTASGLINWVTNVSVTPGTDVVDGGNNDLRAVASGALDDAWQGGNYQNGSFSPTDFVGTSRPQGTDPDIGFFEVTGAPPAGVADVFGKVHRSPVYGATVVKG